MNLWVLFALLYLRVNCSFGLDNTRLNQNTANVNFLLNESGRNTNLQDFPPLPSTNNNGAHKGRVHDLVNFYNNQGKVTTSTTAHPGTKNNRPSASTTSAVGAHSTTNKITPQPMVNNQHSNVEPLKPSTTQKDNKNDGRAQTNDAHKPLTPSNPLPSSKPTAEPVKPNTKPTFSNVLSGGSGDKKGEKPQIIHTVTTKPSTNIVTPSSSTKPTNTPTRTPVLPSSILANQGNRQHNGNAPTDLELQTLSEDLLRKDTNNVMKLIKVNFQEKTTSQSKDDKAPQPLLTIPSAVYNTPTIQKFVPLLDNYERDTLVNEYVTPQERNEENAFLDAIMQTQVIRQLMIFLKDKGYVTPDPKQQRDYLKQMWFNLYSRGKGKISSSGFEHVFVSELKNDEVSGLHNWLYFAKEEAANRVNYLGYLKYHQLADKGVVLKLHFNQLGVDKPTDSMFVGTSPELEMALYSLCFITRPDRDCPLKLGGKDVSIVTHTFRYRSKNMIGSAYPIVA